MTDKRTSDDDSDNSCISSIPPGYGGLIKTPGKNDVLSGRGGRVNAHEGNIRFRNLVGELKHEYVSKSTKKLDKAHIAAKIVRLIRMSDPPGRFLKVDNESKEWIEIGDDKARKKAGQALREDAPEVRSGMDKEKDEHEQKEQMKKFLEMAVQMPYARFPPGYFPNMPVPHPAAYGMAAAPFTAAAGNMVGGGAPIYPAQAAMMMPPQDAAAAMFFQQQQANAAFAGVNPYGAVFPPGMATGPAAAGFMPTAPQQAGMSPSNAPAVPPTEALNAKSPPPVSITMPSVAAIPGIQPTNPNPPKVSKPKTVVAPFGNAPTQSFANLSSANNTSKGGKGSKGIGGKNDTSHWRTPVKEKYRDDDDNDEASEDDDESEQKTETEDMSLVSQMQNSHVSEPSRDGTEDNIWAPTRKGQWLGQRITNKTQKASRGDSSAVGSTVTPIVSNVGIKRKEERQRPDQVVVKNRGSLDTGETPAESCLPRVNEEEAGAGRSDQQTEDIFDGVSMKSVNTFNCSEMNDLQSLSGNSFNALMNGDDFSVAQSIISELSDLQSLETKNQQHMYEKAVRQVNKEYDQYFNNATSQMERQRVSQMYYEAVRQRYADLLAQSQR